METVERPNDFIFSMFEETDGVSAPIPNAAVLIEDDSERNLIARIVADGYETDRASMEGWLDHLEKGKNNIRPEFGPRSTPFRGASNIKMPIIQQAALRMSDRMAPELLRRENLITVSLNGIADKEKRDKALRVEKYENWNLNKNMKEWRGEQETLLYDVPYTGTVFKKTYYNPATGKVASDLVMAPDFAVNIDTTSMDTMRRFTHILPPIHQSEMVSNIRQGLWLDILAETGDIAPSTSDHDEGIEHQAEHDKYHTVLEQECWYDLDGDGYEEPYIITIHKESARLLRIVPRFEEQDILVMEDGQLVPMIYAEGSEIAKIKADTMYTYYGFLKDPEGGFLSVGYFYILNSSVTVINTLINQLIDAGKFSNLPAHWLPRGFREKIGTGALYPGAQVETQLSGAELQQIRALDYKEPSPTLFQLTNLIIEFSRQLSASVDVSSAIGANAPAATTLALIKEQEQPGTAIIGRMHRSMGEEFEKILKLDAKYIDFQQYSNVLDDQEAREDDFELDMFDISASANVDNSSQVQRLQQAEALNAQIEIIAAAKGNILPVIKNYLDAIGAGVIKDEIFPDERPEEQLIRLLEENPELQQQVMGLRQEAQQRMLMEQQQFMREQEREDKKVQNESIKAQGVSAKIPAEVEKLVAEALLARERAETEDTKNQVSIHTTAAQLDQAKKDLNTPAR